MNFVASLPGAVRALLAGQLNSRVPATLLIALGALVPTITDSLNRFGSTELFALGKLVGVVLLFLGFLASVETFAGHPHPVHVDGPAGRPPRGDARHGRARAAERIGSGVGPARRLRSRRVVVVTRRGR